MHKKRIFITVGTTQFQELIDTVCSDVMLNTFALKTYKELVIQYGTGIINETTHPALQISYKPFFDNFTDEINKSDLVISHAGAGSCLETLRSNKPLIVVINEDLMDNHQTELAEKLANQGHLYYCTCSTLKETLQKSLNDLKPYPKPDMEIFHNYLNKSMGYNA